MEIELQDGTVLDAPDDADASAVAKAYLAKHMRRPVMAPHLSGSPTEPMNTSRESLNVANAEADARAGVLEAGARGLSRAIVGVGQGVAGLAARATGHDPAAAKAALEPLVVQPQTQSGKNIVEATGKGLEWLGAPIADADRAIGEVSPTAQRVVREVAGTAGDALAASPLAPVASRGLTLAANAAKDAAPSVAKTLAEKARAAGLRIRPSDVDAIEFAGEKSSVAGQAGEFVAGHDELARDYILHNKPMFNSMNADEVGLPKGSPMGPAELEKAAAPHLKVYERLRNELQPVPMDEEVRSAIVGVDRGNESMLPMPVSLAKLQDTLAARTTVTPGNLIDTISDLRRQGFKGVVSETPDIADMGLAQLRLADSLERQLDAMVARQQPSMVGAYQAARKNLAKIHTLEATNVAGEVDPAALARLNKKTERRALSGAQLLTADMAEAFPKVVTRIVPHAKPIRTGGGDLLTNALKVVAAPVRLSARGLMRATRGESAVPQTGLGRALAEYYKNDIKPGRGVLKLEQPPGNAGPVNPQEGFNFGQPTDVEATGAPFEGAPKVNTGPNKGAPHRGTQRILVDPPLKEGDVAGPAGSGPTPAPRGRELASGRDRIPPPVGPTRGRVLRRSVAQANAAADRLSLEGRMEVPDGRKTPSTDNLRLEHPIEGKLPASLEDLQNELAGKLLDEGWNPNEVRKALAPKLRTGGALSIPEGRVNGLQAPVDWEWKPDDVPIHVLPFDPSDKAALIRFLRGK